MAQFILSLDQGTTTSRAIVFDQRGAIVSMAQKEFAQYFPQPGWVEHDAAEIWSTQLGVAAEAVLKAGLTAHDLAGIGITNQRETTVLWDRATGQPVHRAIVWQDRRTAAQCQRLRDEGSAEMIREKTGLLPDAYFSATKLQWLLDNIPGARIRAVNGELCFGTVDSWLLWKLTAGTVHATDVSNASRTMLFNIHRLQWDEDLLKLFDIPAAVLPQVRSSSEVYGHTQQLLAAGQVPIAGIAGDQQAALFGQACLQPGMVKNTYGTGCFLLMNTGEKQVPSKNNLLTTVAWQVGGRVNYALEGSVFVGGAVVQWLRDGLKLIGAAADTEALYHRTPDNGGVYLVPAFTGLGAPHWNGNARGLVVGLTRGTTQAHLARAALESIAFQTLDVLQAMQADADLPIAELRVDGGASVNNALMQFQADIANTDVVRPRITETTALGAAYLCGLGVGFWTDTTAIAQGWQTDRIFMPAMQRTDRDRERRNWQRAVRTALAWAEDDEGSTS